MERTSARDRGTPDHRARRAWWALCCLAAAALFGAAPARGVTIGQLAPGSPPSPICGFGQVDAVQTTVAAGTDYVVPPFGTTVVSWRTNAGTDSGPAGQLYEFKVFRQTGPSSYTVVGHDGPHVLQDGVLNTFAANIAVRPGDRIGLRWDNGGFATACEFVAENADDYFERPGDLADGASGDFNSHGGQYRLNVTAEVKPSNAFTLGKAKRNAKRGTASVPVDLPGPGQLTVSGRGVRSSSAAARESIAVSGPGQVAVTIRPTGKAKKHLRANGKGKVRPAFTYTPTGGDPSSQTAKVRLRLRR
jgi:hypothetical protein